MAYDAQAGMGRPFTPAGGSYGYGQGDTHSQGYRQPDHSYEPYAMGGTGYAHHGDYGDYADYGDYDSAPQHPAGQAPGGFGKTLNLLAAAASLALVAGIGIWGYQMVSRDVSGVPVVRSVAGPMRVAPENPGGEAADNQGLAVNEVAAYGTAAEPADRLTLAPEAITLTEDDVPLIERSQMAEAGDEPMADTGETGASDQALAAYQQGDINALVAELTEGVEPLTLSESAPAASAPAIVQPAPLQPIDVSATVAAAPSPALLNAPGVAVSLRPLARPARVAPSQITPVSAQAPARTTAEVEADSLPAGTRLAQLGAYESPEVARAEWDRIYSRFSDFLDGKKRVIQRAESGGRIFYRLRAMGFDDLADARRFCSALVAGKADCIPVTTR